MGEETEAVRGQGPRGGAGLGQAGRGESVSRGSERQGPAEDVAGATVEQRNVGRTEDPLFGLTLAEMTLIQQGLWAIGGANAVDRKLVADFNDLLLRLRPLIQDRIAAIEGMSQSRQQDSALPSGG